MALIAHVAIGIRHGDEDDLAVLKQVCDCHIMVEIGDQVLDQIVNNLRTKPLCAEKRASDEDLHLLVLACFKICDCHDVHDAEVFAAVYQIGDI